jgi:hypothetical protein
MARAAHVQIVKLRKWFPPHDPLAAKIARLCILREDLLTEMNGVFAEQIKELDEYSENYRRLYFLRNLIRTQTEVSSGIQNLLNNSEFKLLITQQPEEVQKAFQQGAIEIGRTHTITKDVRNDICGHVRENAVQAALERIDFDSFGFLDVGPKANFTHYQFADELTAEMLLKDVTKEERGTISSSKYAAIADSIRIFVLIERCFVIYAQDRGLLPR